MKNIEIELTEKLKKRFLNKFKKSNDEECWNWLSSIGKGGYGRFAVGLKNKKPQVVNAQRVSWVVFKGTIPEGIWVLHKCDNRKCVNPNHLFLGTRQDNIDDMVIKKRSKHFKKSEFYGVVWEERGKNIKGRWRSFVCYDNKQIYLSRHENVIEAARNYDRIAYIVYGERKLLNFPEEYNLNFKI